MNSPKARTREIVIQEMENETLVYDLKANKALCLNKLSAMTWKYCDGKNSIGKIADKISVELKIIINEEFVEFAVEELRKENLLENSAEVITNISNLSRREAIRRIGLSSALMLPIISSVIAPTALQAQSVACLVNGTVRTCPNTAPGCVQILVSPQIFRCPDAACCSGFCAIQTPNLVGNCAV
ncbi:MAG: hypothetical protein HC846_03380 [Blastocatellia bacterium]|nr:hypothetical protein [Blastocatellia bacterium]